MAVITDATIVLHNIPGVPIGRGMLTALFASDPVLARMVMATGRVFRETAGRWVAAGGVPA